MSWEAYQFGSYTHWADAPLADAWFRYALTMAQNLTSSALNGMAWQQQHDAIVQVWFAMSNGFRAANLCPLAVESYRNAQLQWVGAVTTTDDASGDAALAAGTVTTIEGGYPSNGGTMGARIRADYQAAGNSIAATDPICQMAVRINLGSDGLVYTNCDGTNNEGTASWCQNNGLWSGCLVDGSVNNTNCNPYSAYVVSWSDTPSFGIAAGTTCKITHCLPAFAWSNEFALAVLQQVMTLGVNTLITNAVGFTAAVDIQVANSLNITPAQYQNGVANIPSSASALQWAHNFSKQDPTLGVTVSAIGLVPVVGSYVALVQEIFDAIAPAAVGVSTDPFGLAVPSGQTVSSFIVPYISFNQPSYVVPQPPVAAPTLSISGVSATPSAGAHSDALEFVRTPTMSGPARTLTLLPQSPQPGAYMPSGSLIPSNPALQGTDGTAAAQASDAQQAQPDPSQASGTAPTPPPAVSTGASGTQIAIVAGVAVAAAAGAWWWQTQRATRRVTQYRRR